MSDLCLISRKRLPGWLHSLSFEQMQASNTIIFRSGTSITSIWNRNSKIPVKRIENFNLHGIFGTNYSRNDPVNLQLWARIDTELFLIFMVRKLKRNLPNRFFLQPLITATMKKERWFTMLDLQWVNGIILLQNWTNQNYRRDEI